METRAPTHPSADKLRGFGLGQLADADAVAVMSHLDTCPECQKEVAAVTGDYFLDRLRESRSRTGTPLPGKSLSELARSLYGTIPPTASAPTVSGLPPELANHPQYEVVSELGRGGMGVVYLATHRLSGRHEVLKVMNKELMVRSGSKERFLREIKSAAMLDHPNVVKMYTAMEMGDLMVLVMEYVKGEDLAKLVKAKGRLPVPNACFYAQQTALGLQHAFEKKMVHRDIKPQNLILAREGKKHIVKVLDFGLAKVARETGEQFELTGQGQMLGTPDYVAPEQTLDATNADVRADIYSLGCTLYYLLAGHAPFKGKSLFEILQAHQSMEAKPLDLERPDVPEEVAAIVAKMMAKDPAQRFEQPKEVAQALSPFFRPDAKGAEPKPSQNSQERKSAAQAPEAKETKPAKSPVSTVETVAEFESEQVPSQHAGSSPWETITESNVPSSKTGISERLSRPSAKVSPRTRRKILIGGGVLIGVLLAGLISLWAGGVFKLKTKDGVIVLEDLPADAEVLVDGGTVTVKSADGNTFEVRVEPGKKHRLEVKKDGFKIFGEEVEVDTGRRKSVVVHFERTQPKPDGQDTAKRGTALVTKRFPAEIIDPEQAKWRIEGDELVQSTVEPDMGILFGDPKWADFDFSVDAKMVEGRPGCQLSFRFVTDYEKYGLALDGASKNCIIRPTWTGNKWADQPYHHIEPVPSAKEQWYHFEVRVRGQQCDAFIDGKKIFTFTADDLPPKGRVGLSTWKTSCRFRNIVVKDPKGTILLEGLPDLEEAKSSKALTPSILVLRGHEEKVMHLVFTPDGSRLVSASNGNHLQGRGMLTGIDNTVRIWSVESGNAIRVLRVNEGFGYGPYGVAVSADGRLVAACTSWGTHHVQVKPMVFVWDVATGTRKHHFALPLDTPPMRAVGFSKEGKTVYALQGSQGVIHSWSVADGSKLKEFALGHEDSTGWLPPEIPSAFVCEYIIGPGLVTGNDQWAVHLWDRETGEPAKSFAGHKGIPTCCTMSLDGSRILSCAPDFSVRVWEVKSGRELLCLGNLDSNIFCVAFSPDGKSFLTGGEDGVVRLRDTATGKELARFPGHTAKVNCVAYSPDGRLAASGSDDNTIRLWPLNAPSAPAAKPNSAEPKTGNAVANGPVPNTLTEEVKASRSMPAKEQSFVQLFNGTDLTGWEGLPGYWHVEGGALVGTTHPDGGKFNTYLCSKKTYKDFELQFKVKLTGKGWTGNSGVQIRSNIADSEDGKKHLAVSGPQCDMGDLYWGSLYGELFGGMMKEAPKDVVKEVLKPDDFNNYYIKVVGKHVTIKLNGKTTIDEDFAKLPDEGIIAWQLHAGAPMEVTFKNIEFREVTGQARQVAQSVPSVIGVWEHSVPSKKINNSKELMPDGTIRGEGMEGTWRLEGSTLTLTWGDKGTLRKGIWVDKCTVSPDGKSYAGRDLENEVVVGKRVGSDGFVQVTQSVPSVVGVWEHSVPSKKINYKKELMPDGTITGEGMKGLKGTWLLEGSTLTLTWGDKGTLKNGIWVDKCTVSPDGKSYTGRDLDNELVIGKKVGSDAFVPLFNGKDLTGWKLPFGGIGEWKAQNGMIVSSGPTSHLFSDRGDYNNFHLRAEAQVNDGGNSGLYFRTTLGTGFPKGYEAQINATHKDPQKTGSLYGIVKILDQLHKPDEWFTLEVIAEGDHVVILVNAKKVVDVTDPTYKKGHIALQQHDPQTIVKFRKIEIKELPATKEAPRSSEAKGGQRPATVTTDSGLKYVDLEEGTGGAAKKGDTVVVHYVGTLKDGTKFDSSRDRGEPFSFKIGARKVVAGWDEGVQGMKVGSKRKLIIPSNLGYDGKDIKLGGKIVIPRNSELTFEIQLLEIK
jgi:serine/threonine protein kinase/FKBP-type peptidyl-prolyl cis-trans isomerase/WD40 repeat protein